MSDMIEMLPNGRASFAYVGETPWHLKGNEVAEEVANDIPLFLASSGLDWKAEKVPLCEVDTGEMVDFYAVRRLTDGKRIGLVGPNYQILQNESAFEWFKPFLEAGEARLHTAGALCEGSRVWVLAKLNREPMVIAEGDEVEKYLLLSHAHDGTLAVRVGFTPIRVVCANTLAMAHSDNASKLLRVKHGKNLHENLLNIRAIVDTANQEFEATAEQYRLLVNKQINQKDLQRYVKTVFGFDPDEDVKRTRSKHIMEDVIGLCEAGKGNTLASVRNTYWTAYNGVTEYLAYEYAKPKKKDDDRVDNRLNSLWFGVNAKMNKDALKVATEMALAA